MIDSTYYKLKIFFIYLEASVCLKSSFLHERLAFQSVAVQVVDWHEDSGPLLARVVGVPVGRPSGG